MPLDSDIEAPSRVSSSPEPGPAGTCAREILRLTPYPMLLCTGSSVIFGNLLAARMLGFGDEALLDGMPLSNLFQNDVQTYVDSVLMCEHPSPAQPFPLEIRREDGSTCLAELRADPDQHEGVKVVRLLMLEIPRPRNPVQPCDPHSEHGWRDENLAESERRTGEDSIEDAHLEWLPKVSQDERERAQDLREAQRQQLLDALRDSEAQFRALFHHAGDAIFIYEFNPDGAPERFIEVNEVASKMLGYSRQELLAMPPAVIVGEDDIETIAGAVSLLESDGRATFELTHIGRNGRIPTEVSARMLSLRGQKVVMLVARDITERKMWESALQEANEKLMGWVSELEARNRETAMVAEMGELLQTCTTFEDAYAVVAHSMPKLFPETSGALYLIGEPRNLANSASEWGRMLQDEQSFAPDECWGLRRGRSHRVDDPVTGLRCRHVHRSHDGGYFCIPMMAHGESIGLFHLRFQGPIASDSAEKLAETVSEHVGLALANLRLRQTLRDQAIHDQLTGLFNRRYMEEMLEREVRRALRRESSVGLLMLDVDHFKRFNDVFGHEAGDRLLSELGAHLRRHVREEDVACRYGGEEFVLILPDADIEVTLRRARQLLDGVRDLRVEHLSQPLGPVTVSIGAAIYPAHALSAQDIVRAADVALYRAKSEGRDRVVCASASSHSCLG